MEDAVRVCDVEDAIRTKVRTRRMRLAEFFKDYDRLRSGFITMAQFRHCLDDYFLIKELFKMNFKLYLSFFIIPKKANFNCDTNLNGLNFNRI